MIVLPMTQLPSESERRRKVGMKCPLNLTCCYHLSTCLLTDHRELVFAGISSSRSRGWIDRQAAESWKTRKQPFFYPPQLVPRTQEHLITVEHLECKTPWFRMAWKGGYFDGVKPTLNNQFECSISEWIQSIWQKYLFVEFCYNKFCHLYGY